VNEALIATAARIETRLAFERRPPEAGVRGLTRTLQGRAPMAREEDEHDGQV
jgi:hypothetical protein